jgi:2-dehydropantoate 2-reductase
MIGAVLGAGAMGSVVGGHLAAAGADVTLVDVSPETVDALRRDGLRLEDKAGTARTIETRATADPSEVGPVDLLIVFVKCYHTEAAIRGAAAMIGPDTAVLSLQNGWGNAPRIAEIVGKERVLAGVTYHSATVLAPGRVLHAGKGPTVFGELNGAMTDRVSRIQEAFIAAGLEVRSTGEVLKEIWSKLALNCCTLPTTALLRFLAGQLIEHEGTLALMRGILREVVQVANAQGIALEFDERWEMISGLCHRSAGAKSSMFQDIDAGRRTEIDVVNGAIVDAGKRLGIATPLNDAMVWLVRSLEAAIAAGRKG